MQTKTTSHRTEGFLTLFDMQTTFFNRALDGISDQDAYKRLDTAANHVAWLAGSLVNQRFMMASEASHDVKQTGSELFSNNKGIQSDAQYPTLEEYRQDWDRITPIARQQLIDIDDAKLDSDFDMGGMKMSYYDLLSFTIYREASIIGQVALWRRLLGYPAMKYD
jgi:hypothetical protein